MKEKRDFVADFQRGMSGFEILATDIDDEGCFSWSPCDVCGSKLGGTRYGAKLCSPGADRNEVNVRVCIDCVVFYANGDLPNE